MSDVNSSLETLRTNGGFFKAHRFGLIEVYGRDAAKFLQAQTTNDVMQLAQCSRQLTCLLDRKAHIQAFFELYRRHDSYRIVVEQVQIDGILAHLDRHRIADKVEFLDLSDSGRFYALQGPRCRRVINAGMRPAASPAVYKNAVVDLKLWEMSVHLFQKSVTGEDGYFLWVSNSDAEQFENNFNAVAKEFGLVSLDAQTLETARIESGLLEFGIDFDRDNFLPETGLDQHVVSYTKGCFLGQEVLSRVRSQGAPTRGLVGLLFPEGMRLTINRGDQLMLGDAEIATVKSSTFSDRLGRVIAIASAKRDYRTPDRLLEATICGVGRSVLVCTLPFYQSPPLSLRARELYDQALQLYAKEHDAQAQSTAVELLREVLEMDAVFEDAYEALGVILSKRNRLDEAIALMKQLVELNPDSVMAHTNLSVFYLEKGWKEQAEEEKALSVSIRMRLAARASTPLETKEEKNKQLEETKQRMEMFQQVLEIDSEDLLANYGLGSCHVALNEFAKGIPLLEKAIAIKPSYTVAYLSLAQAHEECGNRQAAIETYQRGIEVAAKRGDMTPLAEMQRRLSALTVVKPGERV